VYALLVDGAGREGADGAVCDGGVTGDDGGIWLGLGLRGGIVLGGQGGKEFFGEIVDCGS